MGTARITRTQTDRDGNAGMLEDHGRHPTVEIAQLEELHR